VLRGPNEASDFEEDHRAEPLAGILARWLRRSGLLAVSDRERIEEAWRACLGPEAEHTHLLSFRRGVATFVVDSSALLAELAGFRKPALLEALRRAVPGGFVRDLRFRLEKPARPSPGGTRA